MPQNAAKKFSNLALIALCLFFVTVLIVKIKVGIGHQLTVLGFVYNYGVLSTLALSCLALLKLRENYKLNIVLTLISTGFAFYVVEVFLVWTTGGNNVELAAQKMGKSVDTRSPLEVMLELKKKDNNIVLSLPSSSVQVGGEELMLFGGMSGALRVFCPYQGKYDGDYVIYENDEYGFHNPKGIYDAPRIDIAAIGDSFAHGFCVQSQDNIFGHMRKVYPNTLNFGKSATGPLYQLAVFREYVEPLRPRIVLWLFYEGNDFDNLNREKNHSILMRYLNVSFSQKLMEKQAKVDVVLANRYEETLNSLVSQMQEKKRQYLPSTALDILLLRNIRGRLGLHINDQKAIVETNLFKEILKKANDAALAWNGKLYFVYLPAGSRFAGIGMDYHYDEVVNIISDLKIPLIDMKQMMITHPDPLSLFPYRVPGAHYNEDGYEFVADTILEVLREEKGKGL